MRIVNIEIINEKAMTLLKGLELLNLIRVKKDKPIHPTQAPIWTKYKGTMSKQPIHEIDQQQKTLRKEWA
ncbi:MAG: hypothetical protein BGO68_05715 [Candidatus Amoebophilus sp. 36-38]|nr:MAG: hypothetical protein BGO68_05715 [Candidatus Amoebophilus sp. 36-38]